MKLPKNNRELTEIFKKAAVPQIADFSGEYLVDMLTGLPSLKRFSHRKVFYSKKGGTFGYNAIFNKKKWGRFFLEQGVCEKLDSLKVIIINYDRKENSFVSNKIRDYVRCVKKDKLYLGRFNYLFMGKPRFLGYFSLMKIK